MLQLSQPASPHPTHLPHPNSWGLVSPYHLHLGLVHFPDCLGRSPTRMLLSAGCFCLPQGTSHGHFSRRDSPRLRTQAPFVCAPVLAFHYTKSLSAGPAGHSSLCLLLPQTNTASKGLSNRRTVSQLCWKLQRLGGGGARSFQLSLLIFLQVQGMNGVHRRVT